MIAVLAVLGACSPSGPTTLEAIAAHKDAIGAIRTRLQTAAAALYAKDAAFPECTGDRGFVYAQDGKATLDIMAVEALGDPNGKSEPIDYMLSEDLQRCLVWASPNTKVLPDPDQGGAVAKSFGECEKLTHVLLTRNTGHDREKGLLQTTFYLTDIAAGRIECQFAIEASADANRGIVRYDLVDTSTNKAVGPTQSRDEYANVLWIAARAQLQPALKQHLGLVADLKP